jgi:hypothetical protein
MRDIMRSGTELSVGAAISGYRSDITAALGRTVVG